MMVLSFSLAGHKFIKPSCLYNLDCILYFLSGNAMFKIKFWYYVFQLEKPKLYGKPEFTTNYSQDPGNIQLKSNSIDVLKECK